MRRVVRIGVSALAGMIVLSTAYLFLFFEPLNIGANRFAPRSEAVRQAIQEGGRLQWPGTTVKEVGRTDVDDGSFVVERRWLGLRESAVRVDRDGSGWALDYSPTYGPAEALQFLLAALLPAAIVAWLVFRRVGRGRRSRPAG